MGGRFGGVVMALATLGVAVGTAAPAQGKSMVKDSIGCFDRGTFERLDRLLYGGESAGFKSVADEKMREGECLPLRHGKSIAVDDIASRLVCVRLDGRLPCLWTWRDTVGD